MTIERQTYRSRQTVEAVQFLGGRAQAEEIVEWVRSHGANGVFHSGTTGTASAALPRREEALRIGQTNPGATTPAERAKSIRFDLVKGDWLVRSGRRFQKVEAAAFAALWERVVTIDEIVSDQAAAEAFLALPHAEQPVFGDDGKILNAPPSGDREITTEERALLLAPQPFDQRERQLAARSAAGSGDESVPEGNDDEGGDDPQDPSDDDTVDEVDDPEHQEDDGEDQEEEAHGELMPPVPTNETSDAAGWVPDVPLTAEQEEAMDAGNNLIGNPFPELDDEGVDGWVG